MNSKIVLAAFAAAVVTTPAAAEWAGPRAEVRVGYDSVGLKVDYDDGVDQFSAKDDKSGVAFGVEVGYDHAFGATVVGAYAGLEMATAKKCDEFYGDDELCIKARRNITLGLRGGFAIGETALVYAKGGYSNSRVKVSYEDFEDVLEDFSAGKNRGGFHLGVGGEVAIAKNVYAKLEYVHTDYKRLALDEDTRVKLSRDQVTAGVGIRF